MFYFFFIISSVLIRFFFVHGIGQFRMFIVFTFLRLAGLCASSFTPLFSSIVCILLHSSIQLDGVHAPSLVHFYFHSLLDVSMFDLVVPSLSDSSL